MPSEFVFDEKGKTRPKPSQEEAGPEKDNSLLAVPPTADKLDASTVTRMQKTVGNAAVQRFLSQRSGEGPTEVEDETSTAINAKRGSGRELDENVAASAGRVMGQDFSQVQVHADTEADDLSRQLGAKAFTTGQDIFFRDGEYNPSSSEGQRLISHELTHVVQQGAGIPSVQGKMTVNDPDDQYEAEADSVADMVMNQPETTAVQAQEEEEDLTAQMQEEEEEVQMQEEEEEVQMQEEEEEVQMQVEEEEESEVQT